MENTLTQPANSATIMMHWDDTPWGKECKIGVRGSLENCVIVSHDFSTIWTHDKGWRATVGKEKEVCVWSVLLGVNADNIFKKIMAS